MSQRDPATGQFRKPTPSEKVAMHVAEVNDRHPDYRSWNHHPTKEPVFGTPEEAQHQWTERREQPLEYENDRQVWPWVLACGLVVLILATAIWVLTH